jgi:hypothetical protein
MPNGIESFVVNFINYCAEDNEDLANQVVGYLKDYVDVKNRLVPLDETDIQILRGLNKIEDYYHDSSLGI